MKYAVIKVVNGNYSIDAEGFTTKESAKVRWHGTCQSLWNAPDVITAYAEIVDENLDCVDGCKEYIYHNAPEE